MNLKQFKLNYKGALVCNGKILLSLYSILFDRELFINVLWSGSSS